MTLPEGTTLTCSNPDCGCRLLVQVPCPHGDTYTCACGHEMHPATGGPAQATPGA